MSDPVLVLHDGGELLEMLEAPYVTEDFLQALLAEHPNLLAGAGASSAGRRWLLIAREAALPDAEDARCALVRRPLVSGRRGGADACRGEAEL